VGGELQRQLGLLQDLAAHDVGQRDFRGRDQVQHLAFSLLAALLRREQVLLELRQLAGAGQRLGVDDVRRVALGVAVPARLHIEHELGERPVQPRHRAAHQREARAGEFRRGVEVEPERAADVDVVAHREVEDARLAPAAHLDVVSDDLPTGTEACGTLGALSSMLARRACTSPSLVSCALMASGIDATSASTAEASSPCP